MFVNVILLRAMDAYQGFDGFDDPLGITDQVAVRILGRQRAREPGQEPGQMQNLTVSAAHRGKTQAIRQDLDQFWIDPRLVVALVFDDGIAHPRVGLDNEFHRVRACRLVEGIGNFAQTVERAGDFNMSLAQRAARCWL